MGFLGKIAPTGADLGRIALIRFVYFNAAFMLKCTMNC